MSVVRLSDIFKKDYFESYSEFYLALEISKVFSLFDVYVDMSDMIVDKSILPDNILEYFKKLISDNVIYVGDGIDEIKYDEDKADSFDIDISYFLSEKMYGYSDNCAYWSFKYAHDTYSTTNYYKFMNYGKLNIVLIGLVSFFIVKKYLGKENAPYLNIDIARDISKNVYAYLNIYSCIKTSPWFSDLVNLSVDFESDVDLDYIVFCNNSNISHKLNDYSVSEKRGFMEKLGMVVGSILILFERKGMCENNRYGKIKASKVIRLDEIGDDFIGYTDISLNKTKEENYQDYLDINEEVRYLYSDLLNKNVNTFSSVSTLHEVGIDEYFGDSDEAILTKIDSSATVSKLITINGEQGMVEMSEIDAIYWLLCQYGIEFDKDLYRSMYSDGNELLWDRYGVSEN